MPPDHSDEGMRALEELRGSGGTTGVLLLSMYASPTLAVRALSAGGATGYLLKERITDGEALVAAVRTIVGGGTVVDPDVVALCSARPADRGSSTRSPRASTRLQLMAEGESNLVIAGALNLSVKTVETHVEHILDKLGIEPSPEEHRRVLAVLDCSARTSCTQPAPALSRSWPCSAPQSVCGRRADRPRRRRPKMRQRPTGGGPRRRDSSRFRTSTSAPGLSVLLDAGAVAVAAVEDQGQRSADRYRRTASTRRLSSPVTGRSRRVKMLRMWASTVFCRNNKLLMALLERPCAMQVSTARSRSLRFSSGSRMRLRPTSRGDYNGGIDNETTGRDATNSVDQLLHIIDAVLEEVAGAAGGLPR